MVFIVSARDCKAMERSMVFETPEVESESCDALICLMRLNAWNLMSFARTVTRAVIGPATVVAVVGVQSNFCKDSAR